MCYGEGYACGRDRCFELKNDLFLLSFEWRLLKRDLEGCGEEGWWLGFVVGVLPTGP
jgi:hypothetical protein